MGNALFEQKKVCPICEKTFNFTRVRSSACYVVKRESDFNVIYRDINPVHYTVIICPHCQYAATEKTFFEPPRPAEMDRLKKGLPILKSEEPDFSGERTPQLALRTFELAIRTAQIRKGSPGMMASLFLRAAWICREMEKPEQELQYMSEALKYYKESFEKEVGSASRLSDVRLMYIIGELNQRLGNLDEAINWFSRAVMNRDIKKEPELERQLREQWDYAREKRKELGSGTVTPKEASGSTDQAASDNKAAANEPATVQPAKPTPRPSYRSKVKMYASVYTDQVEWLNNLSNKCYNKTQVLLGKETVLRAVLDAVMELNLPVDGADTEESLKQQIMDHIQKK